MEAVGLPCHPLPGVVVEWVVLIQGGIEDLPLDRAQEEEILVEMEMDRAVMEEMVRRLASRLPLERVTLLSHLLLLPVVLVEVECLVVEFRFNHGSCRRSQTQLS